MTSQQLRQQLHAAFNVADEHAIKDLMGVLRTAGRQDLAEGVLRLLSAVDESYRAFVPVQRRAEKAKRLVECLDLTGDILCEWDLPSGAIKRSTAWKRRFNPSDEEGRGRISDWYDWVHPEDRALVRDRVATVLQGRAPLMEVEHRLRDLEGEWRVWLLRVRAASRDARGKPTRLLVLHRDVSDQKRVEAALVSAKEEAETANRARGIFLANMSHEIRTPMNAILGMTELALDTSLDDEQRGYLTTVKSSAEALLTIINDILDLSKIEAGRVDLEMVRFSLRSSVCDAIRALAVFAHRKGLEMLLDIAPDVPDHLFGDPTRLRQILANLVGNAIKFTERGEVCVTVSLLRRSEMSLYLEFGVRDTGIGIAAEHHEQIFDAFTQADASTARRFGGTGLGLAISNRLVKLMDGHLWLESEPGEGSTFSFTVRLAADPLAFAPLVPLPAELRGRRALIVDDSAPAADLLARMLERFGMQVEILADAAQFVARLQASGPFDVLFIDADMPAPSGGPLPQVAEARAASVVLLFPSHARRKAQMRCPQAAFKAHLVKPVFEADVIVALRASLGLEAPSKNELEDFAFEETITGSADGTEPLSVLLVEDTPVNQTLAVSLLSKAGHRVTVANNGQEALEWFERQRFDLVLMDLQMPIVDGMEATAAIRAREVNRSWVIGENQRQCYIAAMTAHAMEGDRERCLAAGMDDYLSKPIRRPALHEVLKRALAHRNLPKAEWSDLLHHWGES